MVACGHGWGPPPLSGAFPRDVGPGADQTGRRVAGWTGRPPAAGAPHVGPGGGAGPAGGRRVAEAGRRPRRRGTALACRWRWDPACVFLVARPRPRPSPGAFPRARAPSVEARAPRSPLPPVLPRPGRRLAAPPTGRDRNGPRRAGVASGHRGRWWPRAKCSRLRLGGARAPGARRGTPAPCAGEPWPWRWVVGPSPRELRAGRRGQSPFRALRDRPWCWRPLAVRPRVCSGGRLASGGSVFPPSPRARLSAGRGPSSTATASPAPRPSPPSAFSRALPRRRLFWLPDRGPAPSATRFPGPLRPPPCPPPLPARRRRCVRAGDRPPRRPVLARACLSQRGSGPGQPS